MKKIIILAVTLVFLANLPRALASVPLGMYASGPYLYVLGEDGGAVITGYTGKEEDVLVPESLDGLPVTGIGDKAFSKLDFIRSIRLPEGVRCIGDRAFTSCKALKGILLPPALEKVGPWAFVGCDSLESVAVPARVAEIGDGAFSACKALREILVDKGNPVFESREGVLFNNATWTLAAYPTAREGAEYQVPEGTQTIGARAFVDCDQLQQVVLPPSLRIIGTAAFSGCDSLVRADLPEGVQTVGSAAFYWCVRLQSCRIPASVETVMAYAFINCSSIAGFQVDVANARFSAPQGALYNRESLEFLAWPPASPAREAAVPEGAKAVAHAAFMNCAALEKITLPEGLERIGQDAFRNCGELKGLYVPPSVTEIGTGAFAVWEGGFVLQVVEGSAAHAYAQQNKVDFEVVK